jgi:hypothetical protein
MNKTIDLKPIPESIVEKTWQEVRELAIYMFLVVDRMFQEAHGKIKKISSEKVFECYKHNEGLLERLEGAHEKFLD